MVATVGVEQTVVVNEEVVVLAAPDVEHDVFEQRAVLFEALTARGMLGILLDAPRGPEQGVGLLHLVDVNGQRALVDEVVDGLARCFHVGLEAVSFADGQCEARHRNKGVACTRLEPRISCQQIGLAILRYTELVGGIHQTVVETVAVVQVGGFFFQQSLNFLVVDGGHACAEDNALTFLDRHFKVAGNKQILRSVVATFAFLGIIHSPVPVGAIYPLSLFAGLHIQVGIALI